MIRFLKEDSSSELTRHIPWRLPDGIRKHLEKTLEDNKDESLTKNHTTKEAIDHLRDILSMDDTSGIKFNEMKRMKNWFEKNSNATKTKQYELYGGDIMMNWVNNQLNTARKTAEEHRKARKAAGYTNAYKKEHDTDRQTTVTVADDKTPSYNPMTNNKKNRLKELSAIREQRTVVITEGQKQLIDNTLQLNEIKLRDKYKIEKGNGKTNLHYFDYADICILDPTVRVVDNERIAGKYCNWLLQRFDVSRVDDDVYKNRVRVALEQYNDGLKHGILKRAGINMDIGSFKTVEDLVSTMRNLMGGGMQVSQSVSNNMEKFKGQYEIVGESENWLIFAPKTFEAERYFGSGTEWCTVGNKKYFESYMKRGQLYITVPKSMDNKLKMQFHFESESFADYSDDVCENPKRCIYNVLGESEAFNEVCGMWKKLSEKFSRYRFVTISDAEKLLKAGHNPEDVFDYFADFREGFAVVRLGNKSNFIGTDGRILSDQWFDACDDFIEGFAVVKLGNKYNFIGKDGMLLSDQWFDWCYDFREGFAVVKLGNKYNFIGKDGRMLSDQWFDDCVDFKEGFAVVRLGNKYNFIGKDDMLLSDQWFDDCGDFKEGFAKVVFDGKVNFIGPDGNMLSDQWFDWCGDFREGFVIVRLGGKYNFIGTDGNMLSDQWFDHYTDFGAGFADVKLGGTWYYIDKNGRLYDYNTRQPLNENKLEIDRSSKRYNPKKKYTKYLFVMNNQYKAI